MNGKICIFYFSATGTTGIAADLVRKAFEKNGYAVDVMKIEDALNRGGTGSLSPYDYIGIGCPVIGFESPRILYDFVRLLPRGNAQKVFVFRTSGGVGKMVYNSSAAVIAKLNRKGYDVAYERIFSIGSNFMIRFDAEIMRQLYAATARKIELMCGDIVRGVRRYSKAPLAVKLMTGVLRLLTGTVVRFIAKDYTVSKDCNGCRACVVKCPCHNIRLVNDRITFGFSCTLCMRCVYLCPRNAISFRLFRFFAVRDGYDPNAILNGRGNAVTNGFVPPFMSEYVKNDVM